MATTEADLTNQIDSIPELKQWLTQQISHALAVRKPEGSPRNAAQRFLKQAYKQTRVDLSSGQREELFNAVLNNLFGYGIIQPLLDDPGVTDIMINGPNHIYIEKNGKLSETDLSFPDDQSVRRLIMQIVKPLGRHIDAKSPMVDARLPDGSRVNAVITPVAIDGTSLTIRKFPEISLTIQDLINFNSLSPYMADFLEACVHSKLNIIICGGTSSGKTTTLNILSAFIPAGERIVTIEDSAELQLQQEHVVRLETQPPDTDGEGEVPIRKLVRNALRMRPDRVIIGEVRGGEALDLLQAMNTGHDGSLTTLHGNAPREAIARLETLAMFAGFDLPVQVIRKQVASAVDVIVQQNRLRDGSRKITSIAEVVGLEGETIVMTEIFKFEEKGIGEEGSVLGEFRPSGIRPMFENRLIAAGFRLPPEVFGADKIRLRAKSDRRR